MRHLRFSNASQKLINKFIDEGRLEAFDFVKVLLEITPDPESDRPQEEGMFKPLLKPHSHLDEWQYTDFLKKDYKNLIKLDANKAFELVVGLLYDYVRFSYPNHEKEERYNDISQVWRPAIEDHGQNHQYPDIENSLVTAVRDTAIEIVKNNPTSIKEIVAKLDSNKWLIFRRISLYLLSENPTLEPELVIERLTDRTLFTDSDFRHEYALLAKKGFGVLKPEHQETIFKWIEDATDIKERIEKDKVNRVIPDENALRIVENWQLGRLSHFKDNLTGTWKDHYEELIAKYGEPEHPDFSSYSRSFVGPTSNKNAKDLVEMKPEEMFELLKTWEPKEGRSGFGPTKEGLGREITAAIISNPKHFEDLSDDFKGLDPTYVRAYLDGFYNLAQNNKGVDWEKILSLCEWVVKQPREITDRQGGIMDQDPDWGWTRRTVGSLIFRGFNSNELPFDLREFVWNMLEPLTNDSHPTPDEEKTRDGEIIEDGFNLSINTVRGEAINAVIEYALWVYRNIEKSENGKEKVKQGFAIMPEVQVVLDKHLNPQVDPSIAVRSVYGRYFPWLLLLDRQWALTHTNGIFPPGQFSEPLYHSAWQAYLLHVGAYDEPFIALRDRYLEAVQNLNKGQGKYRVNEEDKLVEHLMVFYWRGKLSMSDNILQQFWNTPDTRPRQYALKYIGLSLRNTETILEPEVNLLLTRLWEQRVSLAEISTDKSLYEGEMSSFGWWFASGKFDDKWSCKQYLKALDIGVAKNDGDYFVFQRLIEMVKILPVETINILKKLVLSGQRSWVVFGNREAIQSILVTALSSEKEEAKKEAVKLINQLVANGHIDFRDLLPKDNQVNLEGPGQII